MIDNEETGAALSEAADVVLKGGGILVFAGATAVAALNAAHVLLSFFMGIMALVLLVFAIMLFGVAVMKIEKGVFQRQRISSIGGSAIGVFLVVLIVLSTLGFVLDLSDGLAVR